MGGITTNSNNSTCAAAMVKRLKIHTNAVWPGPRRARTVARMVSSSCDQSSRRGSREQEHSSRSDIQSRSHDRGGGCHHWQSNIEELPGNYHDDDDDIDCHLEDNYEITVMTMILIIIWKTIVTSIMLDSSRMMMVMIFCPPLITPFCIGFMENHQDWVWSCHSQDLSDIGTYEGYSWEH